jgi:glycosyltransferase involved in cell wall biosynthesis
MMKRIYLEGRARGWSLHSLYRELIDYPPDGYEFVTDEKLETSNKENTFRLINRNLTYNRLNGVFDYFRPAVYYLYYKSKEKQKPRNIDLTYSSQHLIFRKEPWVVDLEQVGALVTYGKLELFRRFVEKLLASKYCKKIMPWSDVGKKSLFLNLDCKKFEEKIETVRLAVHPKKFVKKYDNDKVKLLFVGTVNVFNVEGSFDLRGGKEALASFAVLSKEYDNLELVIRSVVPYDIRQKYSYLSEKVRIIDQVLTWSSLEEEFKSADIFLFPGHTTPGMTILDAMSYELPIIATNVWGNSEIVKDGETGFLIKKSRKVPYYMRTPKGLIYYTPAFFKAIRKTDSDVAKDLSKKVSVLIEDKDLRRKMGRNARREIETGKFSIKKRNEKLKRIFDEATAN